MQFRCAFLTSGRYSSRCSSSRQMSRQSAADVDWYGCDTLDQSQLHPRPHSVAADRPMSSDYDGKLYPYP